MRLGLMCRYAPHVGRSDRHYRILEAASPAEDEPGPEMGWKTVGKQSVDAREKLSLIIGRISSLMTSQPVGAGLVHHPLSDVSRGLGWTYPVIGCAKRCKRSTWPFLLTPANYCSPKMGKV